MPVVQIYRSGTRVESKEFRFQFLILTEAHDTHKLYWQADAEKGGEGGGYQTWIVTYPRAEPGSAGLDYEIKFLLPTWQLIIDGVAQKSWLYSELDVTGKEIELLYGDYRFVCSFPSQEDSHGSLRAG